MRISPLLPSHMSSAPVIGHQEAACIFAVLSFHSRPAVTLQIYICVDVVCRTVLYSTRRRLYSYCFIWNYKHKQTVNAGQYSVEINNFFENRFQESTETLYHEFNMCRMCLCGKLKVHKIRSPKTVQHSCSDSSVFPISLTRNRLIFSFGLTTREKLPTQSQQRSEPSESNTVIYILAVKQNTSCPSNAYYFS